MKPDEAVVFRQSMTELRAGKRTKELVDFALAWWFAEEEDCKDEPLATLLGTDARQVPDALAEVIIEGLEARERREFRLGERVLLDGKPGTIDATAKGRDGIHYSVRMDSGGGFTGVVAGRMTRVE